MEFRYVIGYIFIILGLLGILYSNVYLLIAFSSPPGGGGGGLADILAAIVSIVIGILLLLNLGAGLIFLYPGSLLVMKHESIIRKVFGFIILAIAIAFPLMLVAINLDSIGLAPLLMVFTLPSAITLLSKRFIYGFIPLIILLLYTAYIVITA
ncbi:MAG TPA: hypothetical protein EYH44_01120 [Thermoprotei archaeon]|nr:hypothetical protein [Thermoprotei archaeon]